MAQVAGLVTEFADRHASDVASIADCMQTQLRSRQGTLRSAFGELDAHRESAVAELKVCGAPGSRLLDIRCSLPKSRSLTCALHNEA